MPRNLHPDDADKTYCGRLFGKSAAWFDRARPVLEARGFPKPRPRISAAGAERGPLRWPRAEVDAWAAAARDRLPPPGNDNRPGDPGDPLAQVRARRLRNM